MTDTAPSAGPQVRKPRPARSPWLHVGMIPLTLLWLSPIVFVVFVAIRTFDDLAARGLGALPTSISWEGFSTAFAGGGLMRALGNSIIVTAVGVILSLALSACAAYALSRFAIPGRKTILLTMLAGNLLPAQILLVPVSAITEAVGIYDTLTALVVVQVGFGRPHARPRRAGRLAARPREVPARARRARRRCARARHAVRRVGRARGGQPGQRPVPGPPRLGAPRRGQAAAHAAQPARARPRPAGGGGVGRRHPAHAADQRRHHLPQVGHEPDDRRRRADAARRRRLVVAAHARLLPGDGGAAGGVPARHRRGVLGRWRPHRPRRPRALRRRVAQRRDRAPGPAGDPARLQRCLPRVDDELLGHRRAGPARHRAREPRLPVRRRERRCARDRLRPARVGRRDPRPRTRARRAVPAVP